MLAVVAMRVARGATAAGEYLAWRGSMPVRGFRPHPRSPTMPGATYGRAAGPACRSRPAAHPLLGNIGFGRRRRCHNLLAFLEAEIAAQRRKARPRKAATKIRPLTPSAKPPDIEFFDGWPLGDDVLAAIADMGIVHPTPIQKLSIGPILAGRDVIAKAETGTGKTLAFGAPIMSRLGPERRTVLALVLCPTRELAKQVFDVLVLLGARRGLNAALVVGGDDMHAQIRALQAGAQVVVGTPGRILDLLGQRFIRFPWTEFVVLDEADKMFEIGFLDDVREILATTPPERQTILVSATFVDAVLELARDVTRDPVEIATARGIATVAAIRQQWMEVSTAERRLALARIIERSNEEDVFLVFCERRDDVDDLYRHLNRQLSGRITVLHGGYAQETRNRVMGLFRAGEIKALIATDVASRGLDVRCVTHVVNYQVPREVEDYTHRIGRTGRAGAEGVAITLVAPEDDRRWNRILHVVGDHVEKVAVPGARAARERGDRSRAETRGRGRSGRARPGRGSR